MRFHFVGKGSATAKQRLQHEFPDGIPFRSLDLDLLLPVTRSYKHLGTISSSDCSMQPEITKKLATIREATKAIRGDFLHRPHINLDSRLLILKVLIFSKGLFQAGSWPLLYVSELSRIHTCIMDVFSSIVDAGVARSARRSHESLLTLDGVLAPFVLLLVLRMKLFVRVVCRLRMPFSLSSSRLRVATELGSTQSNMTSVS